MNVLHIFTYFRPDFTGEGIYFEKIRRIFSSNGIGNSVLAIKTAEPRCPNEQFAVDGSISYLGLRDETAPRVSLALAFWLLRNLRGYDAVHFHTIADRYFAAYIVCRLLGVRTLQSCTLDDSPDTIVRSFRPPWQLLARQMVRLASIYVAISPRLYDSARNVTPDAKLRLIPQGVAIPDGQDALRDAGREKFNYGPDDTVLLFVGGLCERKGVDFLVETFPELHAHSKNVRLLIVGPDLEDDYAENLRKRVKELRLDAEIRFAGPSDELEQIYQLSDILVFASHLEGFGNVLLEAMANARPVVSRCLHGVTDYFIEHGKTGYLFETEEQYISSLKCLINDPAQRRAVGAAARQEVSEKFEMSTIAQRYIDLYRRKDE